MSGDISSKTGLASCSLSAVLYIYTLIYVKWVQLSAGRDTKEGSYGDIITYHKEEGSLALDVEENCIFKKQ